MAEQTIVGVDFSGGGDDASIGNTWVTKGRFDGKALTIDECRPISRTELKELLRALPKGSVEALDFPFGVAEELFPDLVPGCSTMKDVWDRVSEMRFEDKASEDWESFDTLRAKHPKIKRKFDEKHYPEVSLSPQDERMRYMTYHGIKMLKELHDKCENRWHIPPLHCGWVRENRVTLLEVMPGAALKAQDLPHRNYKNSKGPNALKNLKKRKCILEKLSDKFDIDLPNFEKYRDLFVFNDNALDSFIAAIVAALWVNETAFHRPEDHQDENVLNTARLEGCIYAPSKSVNTV